MTSAAAAATGLSSKAGSAGGSLTSGTSPPAYRSCRGVAVRRRAYINTDTDLPSVEYSSNDHKMSSVRNQLFKLRCVFERGSVKKLYLKEIVKQQDREDVIM